MSLLSTALVLSLTSTLGVGHAVSRTARAPRIAPGVYVDVIPSKTLWAGTRLPGRLRGEAACGNGSPRAD